MPYLRCLDPITRVERDFPLKKPLITIGRLSGNDVVLEDPALAPTHANLLRKGGTHTLTVVDRLNEIYVNGRRERSVTLKEGDRLLIGRFELVFREGDPEAAPPPAEGGRQDPSSLSAMERLASFSLELMKENTPEQLFKKLLASVVELTRAEKGFIIVFQDGARHLAASHNVGRETLDLSRISDTIVDQVIESRNPIIVSDALSDRKFGTARSVVDLRLSSVMCLPMQYRADLLGVIYLGNDAVAGLFTEDDLRVLQVFATQASLLVHTALLLNELKISNRNLRDQLQKASQGAIIGSCAAIKEVYRIMRRVGPSDLSVLLAGETGTGKELVAREIHRLSERKTRPYISINCGAIPENLLESELFGHKKGSFTGAVTDKVGKVEAADGGTLFLDEIGEMPMNLQVKLLRVLQERQIERVGELRPRPVDFRLISATNKNLEEEIAAGRFREDLYYRLNEITLTLPPLRDRGEDVPLLAQYFLSRFAAQYDSRARGFSNDCVRAMKNYYWPGNVRQLENRVKKAVIMSDRALLSPEDMGLRDGEKRAVRPLAEAEEDFKKAYIREVLELNNWNKAATARDLGVDPRTIFRYIEKFDD